MNSSFLKNLFNFKNIIKKNDNLIILFYHRSIISKFRKFTRALSEPEFRTFLTVSLDDRNGRMARRR